MEQGAPRQGCRRSLATTSQIFRLAGINSRGQRDELSNRAEMTACSSIFEQKGVS